MDLWTLIQRYSAVFSVFLDVAGNRLEQQIPTEIGLLSNLELCDLGNNYLTGAIPKEMSTMSSLRYLRLRGWVSQVNGWNEIGGTIPPELFQLEKLECLDVSGTLLYGVIPDGLCDNPDIYINVPCVGTAPCECCTCDGPDRCH